MMSGLLALCLFYFLLAVVAGNNLFSFNVLDAQGKEVSLSQYQEAKVIIVGEHLLALSPPLLPIPSAHCS